MVATSSPRGLPPPRHFLERPGVHDTFCFGTTLHHSQTARRDTTRRSRPKRRLSRRAAGFRTRLLRSSPPPSPSKFATLPVGAFSRCGLRCFFSAVRSLTKRCCGRRMKEMLENAQPIRDGEFTNDEVRDPHLMDHLQKDGPDHLGLWHNALPGHQTALITSGCVHCRSSSSTRRFSSLPPSR